MNGQPKPAFYVVVGLVVLALVGFAVYRFTRDDTVTTPDTGREAGPSAPDKPLAAVKGLPDEARQLITDIKEIPTLGPAGEYKPQGDVVDVEISDWPGYAPLIWANNGLEPNADSYFARKHGFKLRLKVGEGESETWQALQAGKLGASATTVDVLTLFGSQWKVVVPIQLDWSRGGDGILTRKEITSLNQLKGKVVAVAQHTEAEFFLRFLAQEAKLGVKPLKGVDDTPDPGRINLLYTVTAEDAAKVFQSSVDNGDGIVSGAVTWSPWTVDLPKENPDKIRLLATNRNLLIVADILVVNAAFAKNNPKIVKGLVEGILAGVEEFRKDPDRAVPVAAAALKKKPDEMRELLKDVHLSNHAENLLFLAAEPGLNATFRELYYQARYAYGDEVVKSVVDPDRLINRGYLEQLDKEGLFKGQKVEIQPVKAAGGDVETHALFDLQIRFRFEPNSVKLDLEDAANKEALQGLSKLLKLAPGSLFLLRGHMDTSKVEEFKAQGADFYRNMAVRATGESKKRAEAVKTVLTGQYKVDASRITTEGKGWDEPLPGAKAEENRRVEVRFFQLE